MTPATLLTLAASLLLAQPPAAQPPPAPSNPATPREIFPLVRIDLSTRTVEFDGLVPLDCHDPQTPKVYLELLVCGPDSREHESLVMTRAKPSHIHAALLMLGLEPGAPGRFEPREGHPSPVPAAGPPITIEIAFTNAQGQPATVSPLEWIKSAKDGRAFDAAIRPAIKDAAAPAWLFTGSRFVSRTDPATGQKREVYDADGTGVVIGLHTFGSEVVGLNATLSPDASTLEPEWIADPARVPAMGTKVIVRLKSPADPAHPPAQPPPSPAHPPQPPPASPPRSPP